MKKKILSGVLTLMLTTSLLSGCGKSNGLSSLDFSNTTLSGIITAVDSDKVTISMTSGLGGGRMGNRENGEGRGKRQDANAQSSTNTMDAAEPSVEGEQTMPEETGGQTPPEMPEGTDGQTPPEMPEGTNTEAPTDMPGGNNLTGETGTDNAFRNMLSQGGSTFKLTITDESLLKECTMDDIAEGSFITITFGEENTITSITVMKLTNTENASPNGQRETAPDKQDASTEAGTTANSITEDSEETDVAYSSTNDDENALRLESIFHYTVDTLTTKKFGETSNTIILLFICTSFLQMLYY